MGKKADPRGALRFRPLTRAAWDDFEALFGERGACGGCWCTVWRQSRADYEKNKGVNNRRLMKALVDSGAVPGILAYDGSTPVAWCAVAPRETILHLVKSRTLEPPDNRPVWSVTCFFIHKNWRGQGVGTALLEAAAGYVRERGGTMLEGYPVIPRSDNLPPAFAWTGVPAIFERAGFVECPSKGRGRKLMRRAV